MWCAIAARRSLMKQSAAMLIIPSLLTACAAMPSSPTGTSEPAFAAASEIPRRVTVRTEMIGQDDPLGRVLSTELPRLGFSVVYEDVDGALVASTRRTDFGPSRLELTLVDERSGRVLWTARVVQKWEMHASIIEEHEQNARKALELLERELIRVGFTAP